MKSEFSAGGIVFKKSLNKVYVLLCQHSGHHSWVFPKGKIGDHIENESKENTALREVEEETGAIGKIIKPLEPIIYWYQGDKQKIKKTVYYYLMEYVSGDITKHDFEMENTEWLTKKDVEKRLAYASDKKVWREAKKYLASSF